MTKHTFLQVSHYNTSFSISIAEDDPDVLVTGISLDNSTMSLTEGESALLSVTVSPSNATNKTLKWTSSDSSVATVTDGTVHAIKAGIATITATATDGSGVKASCEVTVKKKVQYNGPCGEGVSYAFNRETGTLVIRGAGAMADYPAYADVPWYSYCDSIRKVIVHAGVTSIGSYAFYGCSHLTQVRLGMAEPPSVASNVFNEVDKSSCVLYVPAGSVDVYKAAMGWKDFQHIEAESNNQVKTTDLSTLDYAVYTPGTMSEAGRQAEVKVNLKNATAIATWQADLVLPEGFTVATDSYGEPMIVVSGSRTSSSRHAIATNTLADGSIRILYCSSSNKIVTGTDGEVATLTLNIADDVMPGEYPVIFKNIVLSQTNGTGHEVDSVVSKISITDHNYGDPAWDWAADGKTATATFSCIYCDDSHVIPAAITSGVKTPATCTEKGTTTYTATVTFEGETYTSTKGIQDIPAAGHDYVYTDNGDGTHTVSCSLCDMEPYSEAHQCEEGVCIHCHACPVTALVLSADSTLIEIGDTLTLVATITPLTATNQHLMWTSSDEAVATVADGIVTAVGEGTATITVTACDGSGVSAACTVTVVFDLSLSPLVRPEDAPAYTLQGFRATPQTLGIIIQNGKKQLRR